MESIHMVRSGVHRARLEVNESCPWDGLAALLPSMLIPRAADPSLRGIDPVFVQDHPAGLCSDLVAALAGLDLHDLMTQDK
jgi:hypothetical protein